MPWFTIENPLGHALGCVLCGACCSSCCYRLWLIVHAMVCGRRLCKAPWVERHDCYENFDKLYQHIVITMEAILDPSSYQAVYQVETEDASDAIIALKQRTGTGTGTREWRHRECWHASKHPKTLCPSALSRMHSKWWSLQQQNFRREIKTSAKHVALLMELWADWTR